jgi:hypothetical protein
MQYVQIKSCSDVKIVYKIKILTSSIYTTFHIDNKSIDGRERKDEIEGTKGVIRICKSKKDRQPNDQEQKCTTMQTTIYKKDITEN